MTDEVARMGLATTGYTVDFSDETLGQRFFDTPSDNVLVTIPDGSGSRVPCVSLIRMSQLAALGRQTSNIIRILRISRDSDSTRFAPYILLDRLGQPARHRTTNGGWVTLRQDGIRVDNLVSFSNFLLQDKVRKLGPDRVSALANFCLAAAEVWSVDRAISND